MGVIAAFVQILEGDPARVDELFDVIRGDPRHHDVVLLDVRSTLTRTFERFSMRIVDAHALPHFVALNDLLGAPRRHRRAPVPPDDPGVRELLDLFRCPVQPA